jgi:hypothetical protein
MAVLTLDVVNNELERMWKDAAMVYFNVLDLAFGWRG